MIGGEIPSAVGAGRWMRGKHTSQFIQHPMFWSCYDFQVLFGTLSHGCARHNKSSSVIFVFFFNYLFIFIYFIMLGLGCSTWAFLVVAWGLRI